MKYKIITFGCGFNRSDAERTATVLEQMGYKSTSKDTEADLILVLACSVRQSGIHRVLAFKRKFKQIRKQKPIITLLSGCVLPADKSKMKKIFDIVFDIKDLPKLPALLKAKSYNLKAKNYLEIKPSYNSNFQASIPIITGCNNFCTYCAVPYVRGREKSRRVKDIIDECKGLIGKDYKLIELLGQNVNSYKSQNPNYKFQTKSKLQISNTRNINFSKLLKIVDSIPGDYWLTFGTSHPKDMSNELIKVMSKAKHLIPYINLPIQAGDNKILRKMNRRYTVAHYKGLVRKIRKAVPGIAVSTDIIVGFPGETKKQFANSAKLMRELKFDMVYLAKYSPRAGTVAARMKDNVSLAEKKRRERELNKILKKTALEKNRVFLGKTIEALVDKYEDGYCFGRTKHFKNIKFKSETNLIGQIVLVKVSSCYAWGLEGELPKVVVILGTTASGKTKLAVKLARKFNGEIISADSRQVYKGMDIGTGKDLDEYVIKLQIPKSKLQTNSKASEIPYHLIDAVDPRNQFTVAEWQKLAYEKIQDILKRGKLPIVCGGTGLYISALVHGYYMPEVPNSKFQVIRKKLNKLTLKQLLSRLKQIDPETYDIVDKNNRRRVQRALEIYYETEKPKSQQQQNQKPPYDFLQIGVTFPKDVLHKRIDKRLEHRVFEEGMIPEVKRLKKQGVSWKRLDEFGLEYRWVAKYLQKQINKEELLTELSKAIKNFAKRQGTWFRRDKTIIWENNFKKIEKLVRNFLK